LLRTHKEVFLESNFTSSVSRFLNEQPLSEVPFLYKVYLLALQIHGEKGISFEGRRSLISETIEVLPCIANQEKELLGAQPNFGYKKEWYNIQGEECMFYTNIALKLGPKLPTGSLIAKVLIKK